MMVSLDGGTPCDMDPLKSQNNPYHRDPKKVPALILGNPHITGVLRLRGVARILGVGYRRNTMLTRCHVDFRRNY